MTAPTLTARGLRQSRSVERQANASLVLTRPHSVTDRDTSTPLGSVALSGAHLSGATALTLRATDSGALRGKIPKGLVLTIGGTPHTTQADATASSNAIAVTVSPGLDGAKSDGEAVTLAESVTFSYAKVVVTSASAQDQMKAQAFGREISYRVTIPGRGATTWVEDDDLVAVTMLNGYPVPIERLDTVETSEGWQRGLA